MIGLNTPDPKILLDGVPVTGFTEIKVVNNAATQSVSVKFPEDPQVAALAAAGITVRREA